MRKKSAFVFSLLFLLFSLVPHSVAAMETTGSASSVDTTTLEKDSVVTKDYYAANTNIDLLGTTEKDAVLAGSSVDVSGTVKGDLLAAGNTLVISGDVEQDARLAGSQLHLSGTYGKNLWAFGMNVTVSEETQISGSLLSAGAYVTVNGIIDGDARLYGSEVTVNGQVKGDLYIEANSVYLGDEAVVEGNLNYGYSDEYSISKEAIVKGETESHELSEKYQKLKIDWENNNLIENSRNLLENFTKAMDFGLFFYSFFSLCLIGFLLYLLYPKSFLTVKEVIDQKLGLSMIVGFLSFPTLFFLTFFLIFSFIGWPLLFLILALFFILTYLGKLYLAYYLGAYLLKLLKCKKTDTFFAIPLGLFCYKILTVLPLIGPLISLLASCLIIGSLTISLLKLRKL